MRAILEARVLPFDEARVGFVDERGSLERVAVALDEALEELANIDPRKGKIVELRFFGGLSVEETAEFLGISAVTVRREWAKAKAWLYRELSAGKEGGDAG